MYGESDYRQASKQAALRVVFALLLAAVFLAGTLTFNHLRLQVPTLATAAVGFAVVFFLWSFKVTPWTKYNRFLREMRNGQRRKTECSFLYLVPETRMHDGVEVYEMIVTVGTGEEDERLYYLDADKPEPALREGDRIRVESFGNFITGIERA